MNDSVRRQAVFSFAFLACSVTAFAAGVGGCSGDAGVEPGSSTPVPAASPLSVNASSPAGLAVSSDELAKITAYLADRAPAGAIVASRSAGSDVFDCVQSDQQRSVRLLKAQGIVVDAFAKPPSIAPATALPMDAPALSAQEALQIATEACPQRSVPVRRIPLAEIASYGTLEAYLNRPKPNFGAHSLAVDIFFTNNYGAESVVNIWNPYIENAGEFSLSQLWVQGGFGSGLQSVEVGTQRWFGKNSRLFVYYTANGYSSGCYNTDCGFVQVDHSVYLDADWSAYSSSGGPQYEKFLGIMKEGVTGDWWVRFGTDKWIGYWPRSLFNSAGLQSTASQFAYGGEVQDMDKSDRTMTVMGGDGSFATAGWQHAAYQRSLRYYTYFANNTFYWDNVDVLTSYGPQDDAAGCYNSRLTLGNSSWNDYQFFGGPGLSATCQ
jgi:hypothetical protein